MLTSTEDVVITGIGAAIGFVAALRLSQDSAVKRARDIRAATDLQDVRRLAEDAITPWHAGGLIFLTLWAVFSVAGTLVVFMIWKALAAL